MQSSNRYDLPDGPEQAHYSDSGPNDNTRQQFGPAGAPGRLEKDYLPYYTDNQSSNSIAPYNAQGTHGSFPGTEQHYWRAQPGFQSYQRNGISSQRETVQYGDEQRGYGQPEKRYPPTTPHEHQTRYMDASPSFTGGNWSFPDQAPQTGGRRNSQCAYDNSPMLNSYSVEADFAGSSRRVAVHDAFEIHPPYYQGGYDRQYLLEGPMEQSEDSMDIDANLATPSPTLAVLNNESTLQQPRDPPWSIMNNRRDLHHPLELVPQILDTLGASDSSTGGLVSLNAVTPDLSTSTSCFFQDVQNSMEYSQLTAVPNNAWDGPESMQAYHQPSPPQHGYYRRGVPHLLVQRNTPEMGEPDGSGMGGVSQTPSTAGCSHRSPSSGSTLPDPVRCDHCTSQFSGPYRKGNLGRHDRQKHRGETPVSYFCESEGCDRVFARKDARLKHHRKHHEHLVPNSAGSHRSRSQRRESAVASQQLDSASGEYSGYPHGQPSESQEGFSTFSTLTVPLEELEQREQYLRGLTY